MEKIILVAVVFFASLNANAATMLYENTDVETVKASILETLVEREFIVDQESANRLVLTKEIGGAKGALLSFLDYTMKSEVSGNKGNGNPKIELAFTFIKKPEGTKVIATRSSAQPLQNGNVSKDALSDGDLPDLLLDVKGKMNGDVAQQKPTTPNSKKPFGVSFSDLNPKILEYFHNKDLKGVVVVNVTPKSVADSVGVKIEDVIFEFDGKPILVTSDLQKAVAETTAGSKVVVKAVRNNQDVTFNAQF